ncbi:MAG: MBL fold metallo-hydrolase [Limnochordia bacterium]|jgi:competence protein ComEC
MKRLVGCLLLVLLLASAALAGLDVHFLDVGQGDSILIITAQEKTLLIDGGTEDAGRRVVVPYLQDLGVEKIDVLVATHPHVDHIGGLIPVLASFPVGRVIADGQIHTTRTYERFLTAILEQDIPFHTPKRGEYIALPGTDEILVLHPGEDLLPGLNNNSVVLRLVYKDVAFLFPGDLEARGEKTLLASGLPLAAQVLKVPHHGSKTSSTLEFLQAVSPRIGVIQVGADNVYGHPDEKALENLKAAGAMVFRTDEYGRILIRTDGADLQIFLGPPLDLNEASLEEIEALPGIGPVLARRIVAGRPFGSIEELTNVPGIGPGTLRKLRGLIRVSEVEAKCASAP